MKIFPITWLALFLFALPASSQILISGRQVVEVTSMAPVLGKADHSTIAVNDRGDAFVTWSSSIYPQGHPDAVMRRVEGAYLRRVNLHHWVLYPTVTLGEADPTLLPGGVALYANGDNCRKPDVVAVGRNFVVAWQRLENGNSPNGRLECAQILVGDDGKAELGLAHQAGIGYLLDAAIDPRTAGTMVDLAHRKGSGNDTVIAAYCSRTDAQATHSGTAYDFEIRAIAFKFNSLNQQPNVKHVQVLAADVAFDDFFPGDPVGGRVLPDIVFDKFGNLVLAYEDYRLAVRTGGTDGEGKICIKRFEVSANGTFPVINEQEIHSATPNWALRRPNMIRTGDNTAISLTFGERLVPSEETDVYHYLVDFQDSNSDAILTDLGAVMTVGIEEDLPVPMQLRDHSSIVICADPRNGSRRLSTQTRGESDWVELSEFRPYSPWRPGLDVMADDPWRPGKAIVGLTCEGVPIGNTYSRIYFQMITL
ncbi:MAG: hypothetical protein H8E15_09965 [Planctomycetes bacterium]|nr:hypothetical protein [Planctomycetota bacterium]